MAMSSSLSKEFLPLATGALVASCGFLDYMHVLEGPNTKEVAPTGILENIANLGNDQAPFWIHSLSRRMDEINFRLAFPGLSVCMIGEYNLAREILKDSDTDKPQQLYKNLEGTAAKTMFTSSNDEYMRSLHKATAHAFSKKEVGRMNEVADKQVSTWMQTRLQELCKTGESFDPAHEFKLITFLVICEAAFEYEATRNLKCSTVTVKSLSVNLLASPQQIHFVVYWAVSFRKCVGHRNP